MKRWLVAVALAVAGCQTATTATTSEELAAQDCHGVANFCDAKLPPASNWLPGDPFPQSTPDTVVLFLRESSATWQVFGADPLLGKVMWRRTLKTSAVGSFMNLVGAGTHAYGGVRPPPVGTCPPICIDPGALITAAALRMHSIQALAEADAAACPLK
jgi:hypothetical protein